MKYRTLVSRLAEGLAVAALFAIAALPALAQSTYKAPRTPDGVPDLQGVFLTTSSVPLERPQNLGEKEFYSAREVEERDAARANRPPRDVGIHYDNAQFALTADASGTVPNLRTSIVTGKTGRLPATLPTATARMQAERADRQAHLYDGPEYRGIAERCIYWGFEGPPMMPGGYNGNVQIVQGPGYVTLMQEMIHDVRIIPTDGRAHAPSAIKSFFGDSVGHWEGDTLVVDTTNFNDQPPLGRGTGESLHVVERFTATGPKTINYQFTVTDPTVWEQSWSGEFPLGRIDGQIYEYACQEGNYGMYNILAGARQEEREAAAKK